MKKYLIVFLLIAVFDANSERKSWTPNELIKIAKEQKLLIVTADTIPPNSIPMRKVITNFDSDGNFRKNLKKIRSTDYAAMRLNQVLVGDSKKIKNTFFIYFENQPSYIVNDHEELASNTIFFPPLLLSGKWVLLLEPREDGGFGILEDIGAFQLVEERLPKHFRRAFITQTELDAALK